MKAFRITITFSDPYPKEKVYIENATYYDFAQKKAHIKFRKEMKGKRLNDVLTRCQDLGTLLKENVRTKVPVSRDPALDFLNKAMAQIA